MQSRIEMRSNIKLGVRLGQTQQQVFQTLRQAYGDEAPSKSTVHRWFLRIQNDQAVDLKGGQSSGRPCSTRTAANIAAVKACVDEDSRQTVRQIAVDTGISRPTVHRILTKELKLKNIASRFVPHILSEEQRERHCFVCMENLVAVREDPTLLDRIITMDESWISTYEPELKSQSMHWLTRSQARPTKARRNRAAKKSMLLLFFDSQGTVHSEFLPDKQTVKSEYFIQVLGRVRESIRKKRPQRWQNKDWVLLQDNASSHTAGPTQLFLFKHGVETLQHPAYSPDLAPCDYWAFPFLKSHIRSRRFDTVEELHIEVRRILRTTDKADYSQAIHRLTHRWQKCLDHNGHYFEGQSRGRND